jgi:hypothetical protein
MLSPRSSIARLAVLLQPNEHRAAQELELTIDNVPEAENRLHAKTPCINELKRRSDAVFSKFPKAAIIDDAALYNKHLRALIANRTNLSEMEVADLRQPAADEAKKEAKKMTEAYQQTLPTLKKAAYATYREITQKLSLYGQCPVSLEDVYSSTPENFLIVEKRYTVDHVVYSVPGRTEIYQAEGFKNVLNNKAVAQDPIDRDLFFSPKTYPNSKKPGDRYYHAYEGASYPCHYVYYPYEQKNGHALSLQLCEAMEAFLDPALAAAKQAALNKTKPPTVAPPTKTKPKQSPAPAPRRGPRASNLVSNSLFIPIPTGENIDPEVLRSAIEAGISLDELGLSRFVNRRGIN